MAHIGRNDPCPCGSGKKYKKCCYLLDGPTPTSPIDQDFVDELNIDSAEILEALQQRADELMAQQNSRGLEEFHGLSPHQMHDVLSSPLDNCAFQLMPQFTLQSEQVNALFLANALIDFIGDGVKATAKGNLPRAFCQELYQTYNSRFKPDKFTFKVNKEEDFLDLNVVRILMEMGKFIRKYKGRFVLTNKLKDLIKQSPNEQALNTILFEELFDNYCQQFNWAYSSYDEAYKFIQQSVGFSLYMLAKYGNVWRDQQWYSKQFIQAFPAILLEIGDDYLPAEVLVDNAYQNWVFRHFANFFGLIETKTIPSEGYSEDIQLKTTDLCKQLVALY